jgi:hypothetical protein
LALVAQSKAQKATAPSGYYPVGYHGTMFTGTLDSINRDTHELTLIYVKGGKIADTFIGHLYATCQWTDKKDVDHQVDVSDLTRGTVLTAFYFPVDKKNRRNCGQGKCCIRSKLCRDQRQADPRRQTSQSPLHQRSPATQRLPATSRFLTIPANIKPSAKLKRKTTCAKPNVVIPKEPAAFRQAPPESAVWSFINP